MRGFLAGLLALLSLTNAEAQVVGALPFNLTNGSTADATQVMSNYNFIVNQVNANAANNGANANITSLSGLTTPLSASQGGSQLFTAGTSTGAANAQVVSSGIAPIGFSLVQKNQICFLAGFTNTAATTLNVNGTGVKNVFKPSTSGPIALAGGELVSGNLVCAQYDGTQYEIVNGNLNFVGKNVTLASATTTDLGTVATHNITISGVTTITSFGSSAQADYPLYFLKFSGALTLTNNATSLILPGGVSFTTAANDTAIALYLGSGNWQVIFYQPVRVLVGKDPTVQVFTSGTSQTYTPTAGTVRIEVEMVGPGGGGGASVTNAGTNGSAATAFGTWTAAAGSGGGAGNSVGGAGGTGGTDGTGTRISRFAGADGDGGSQYNAGDTGVGSRGGSSVFGGGGSGAHQSSAGGSAKANTGSGGGGGNTVSSFVGAGGGAGEYVKFFMTAAQVGASQTYTVGVKGTGGAAGGFAGGNGADGCIIIKEFYN